MPCGQAHAAAQVLAPLLGPWYQGSKELEANIIGNALEARPGTFQNLKRAAAASSLLLSTILMADAPPVGVGTLSPMSMMAALVDLLHCCI